MNHSDDAEQSVLAYCLKGKTSEIVEVLTPSDFYEPKNKKIYESILNVYQSRLNVDIVTVAEDLQDGSMHVYLADLLDRSDLVFLGVDHAKIVKNYAIKRRLAIAAEKILQLTQNKGDSDELLQQASLILNQLHADSLQGEFVHVKDVIHEAFDELSTIHARTKDRYIPTGFVDLDKILLGWHPSDLVILAARPSVGKTTFALNLMLNVAKQNKKTALISLEMSARQLGMKIMSAESGIAMFTMQSGFMQDSDWLKLPLDTISKYPIRIYDDMGSNLIKLQAAIRKLHAQEGLEVLFIDYLQLMSGDHYRNNRVQEISEISRVLKQLARELGITIVALSQLSRQVEARSDKRPILSDLRESGAIEQDADIVLMLHREHEKDSPRYGIVDVLIRKHRNGALGDVQLRFDGAKSKFTDTDRVPYIPKKSLSNLGI